jgi:hypothetical protein
MIKQRRVLFAVLLLWTLAYTVKSTIGNPDELLKSFFLGLADSLVLVGILYVVWNWVSKRRLLHARGLVRKIVFTLLLSWALLDAILSGLEAPKALESSAWVGVLAFFVSLGWSLIFVALTFLAWNWIAGFRARNNSAGLANKPTEDRTDNGTLFTPPSAEAGALLEAMTEEEKYNFTDLLRNLQEWHESVMEKGSLSFHPEARARLWGIALAKIADHYHEIGLNDKALFFMSTAWNLSRYPVFAFNVAVLSTEAGDLKNARTLLETYLAEYRNILTSPSLMLMNPNITLDELEDLAKSARARLTAIKSQTM